MALCRCIENHSEPKGRKFDYLCSVEPLGYPDNTSSICGRINCGKPGQIWLTKEEHNQYLKGKRIFTYASAVSKVKVK